MMNISGEIRDLYKDLSGRTVVSLVVNRNPAEIEELMGKPLDIRISRKVKKRTLDANALLWACIGDIAQALRTDKWTVYLIMLRRYGKYTYVVVRKDAVPMITRQWRETEVVGDIEVNGQPAVQMLCYYGSSTYDAEQFSVLLDGVISEMKEMKLPTPDSAEMRRTIAAMEKKEARKEGAITGKKGEG